jgi:hypothetical protein
LFRKVDYGNKDKKPEKLSWAVLPANMFSAARRTNHDKRTAKASVVCFGEKITETKSTAPNTVQASSSGFCSEAESNKRRVPRKEVFVSARRSQALRSKTLKLP